MTTAPSAAVHKEHLPGLSPGPAFSLDADPSQGRRQGEPSTCATSNSLVMHND